MSDKGKDNGDVDHTDVLSLHVMNKTVYKH
jgi:hypothetical protein